MSAPTRWHKTANSGPNNRDRGDGEQFAHHCRPPRRGSRSADREIEPITEIQSPQGQLVDPRGRRRKREAGTTIRHERDRGRGAAGEHAKPTHHRRTPGAAVRTSPGQRPPRRERGKAGPAHPSGPPGAAPRPKPTGERERKREKKKTEVAAADPDRAKRSSPCPRRNRSDRHPRRPRPGAGRERRQPTHTLSLPVQYPADGPPRPSPARPRQFRRRRPAPGTPSRPQPPNTTPWRLPRIRRSHQSGHQVALDNRQPNQAEGTRNLGRCQRDPLRRGRRKSPGHVPPAGSPRQGPARRRARDAGRSARHPKRTRRGTRAVWDFKTETTHHGEATVRQIARPRSDPSREWRN